MIHPMLPPDMPFWISKMLPPNNIRYAVEVGDQQQMHVMETGQGVPVLMMHGNPTWSFLYRRIMARLADAEIRCITPDLIGLGFSSKPRSFQQHTLENHARWLGNLIDQLDLDGFVFVGQDWGGPIGLRAFADRPHLLKGMVILNTAVTPPNPDFKPTAFHRFSRIPILSDMAFRIFGFPQNILHKVQTNPNSISGNIARAYQYPLRRFRDNLAPLALARMVPDALDHPSVQGLGKCRELIGSFSGPCEIIWGTKDPILGRSLKRVRAVLPHARVIETNAGHFIQEEKPVLIAEAVARMAYAVTTLSSQTSEKALSPPQ